MLNLVKNVSGKVAFSKLLADFSQSIANSFSAASYSRAVTAYYVDYDGVLKSKADNLPRFEPTGYLSEVGITNLMPTDDFTAADAILESTVVDDGTVGPDGTGNSYKITATDTGSIVVFGVATTNGVFSLWIKAGTSTSVTLVAFDGGLNIICSQSFDITNEWRRYQLNCPGAAAIWGVGDSVLGSADIGQYFYVAKPQIEEGNFATSFIPPSGGIAARNPDVASLDPNVLPSKTSSYTIACTMDILGEINTVGAIQNLWTQRGETYRRCDAVFGNSPATATPRFYHGASTVTDYVTSSVEMVANRQYRVVCRFTYNATAGNCKLDLFLDGVNVGTKTGISGHAGGSATSFDLGHNNSVNQLCGHISNLRIYNRALNDNEIYAA